MNILHLLWIVPVAFSAGFAAGALLAAMSMQAAAWDDDEEKEYSGLLTED